ncbi:MAG: ATP-dependent DNA helicase RecG [Pseudomonadales bacterium]
MTDLAQQAVTTLKGVGPKLQAKLAGYGISSVGDILFHLPLRYQDRTRITAIGALRPGEDAVIEGEVRAADIVYGRRRSLVCRLEDSTGLVTIRLFHFSGSQKSQLSPGRRLRCYGEPRRGANGLEFYHPEYQYLDDNEPVALADRLTPVYPSTEGIHQASWRKLCGQALELLAQHPLADLLPSTTGSLNQALQYLHQPPVQARLDQLAQGQHPCQQRLALEELVAHNVSLLKLRQRQQEDDAPSLTTEPQIHARFLSSLPFKPTKAQSRVAQEIGHDIARSQPMLRLVQGDVGSGKTLVAAFAALQAVANGYQVAIMAPTEILAEQHLQSFSQWFEPMGYSVAWLVGKLGAKQRREQLAAIVSGHASIVIGTHALFQDDVEFNRLGLVIIDEQHRFGVHQRLKLKEKGKGLRPHQLVMTATPIPRTLAMTAYADLDVSIIDELPPGRKPVQTVLIDAGRRDKIIERVHAACLNGAQAYWVCTLIEESESLQAQAAEATANELAIALNDLTIGLIHGRLKPKEKADLMARFKAGDIHLLVATTVIEVGVDVPNANLMIIENPERLGLAQLHQLRGRVGRGSKQSHCVLLYQTPLSQNSRERLGAMRDSNDGFYIAEKDLEIRGPGEVLGTRQTGDMQFRIADLLRDEHLLEQVHQLGKHILQQQPDTVEPLIRRWLGQGEQYAQV